MKVKGKALEEFDNWIIIQEFWDESFDFEELHESMKWGVYQDFFDSVGVMIEQTYYYDMEAGDLSNCFSFEMSTSDTYLIPSNKWFKTRQEARQQAIEKAVEIFNERV